MMISLQGWDKRHLKGKGGDAQSRFGIGTEAFDVAYRERFAQIPGMSSKTSRVGKVLCISVSSISCR
jgi:hypothetical protein